MDARIWMIFGASMVIRVTPLLRQLHWHLAEQRVSKWQCSSTHVFEERRPATYLIASTWSLAWLDIAVWGRHRPWNWLFLSLARPPSLIAIFRSPMPKFGNVRLITSSKPILSYNSWKSLRLIFLYLLVIWKFIYFFIFKCLVFNGYYLKCYNMTEKFALVHLEPKSKAYLTLITGTKTARVFYC